jgi:hypothetical protein
MKKLSKDEVNKVFNSFEYTEAGKEIDSLKVGEGLALKFDEWPFKEMSAWVVNAHYKKMGTKKHFLAKTQRENGVILIKRNS